MVKINFYKKYRLLFLFAGTLVMMVVMAKTGATLKTPATPNGILHLEFAYNASKATDVIIAWSGFIPVDNNLIAIVNTWIDFIFLFFYSLFFYYLCKWVSASCNGILRSIGNFLAPCALVAGMLDILENVGMLITLHGHISNVNTMLTFIFSISKWSLILAVVLYNLIAGAFILYKKTTKSS